MGLNEVILTCLGVALAGIGWAIRLLITLHSRTYVIDARWDWHEKQDDQRHKENLEKFDSLFEQIRQLRLTGERSNRQR